MTRELTIAIHAQIPPNAGGVAVNLLTLLGALQQTPDAPRQVIIASAPESEWLASRLGRGQSLLEWPEINISLFERPRWVPRGLWMAAKRAVGSRAVVLARMVGSRSRPSAGAASEALGQVLRRDGVKVLHFPYQQYFSTGLPTLFEPWDLQHRHYPQFFSDREILLRERICQAGCADASLIVTASQWSKRDVMQQFGVPSERIAVVRRGPPSWSRTRLSRPEALTTLQGVALPERFILYPANTWPHKNHVRLLTALALLRAKFQLAVPLVCTGHLIAGHWPAIRATLARLDLQDLVFFTGFLPSHQMVALFHLAAFLIYPSLFEGLGIPLLEAMQCGLPVVASDAGCLPEIAGEAARYFDPDDEDAIAGAVYDAWSSPELLRELQERGRRRIIAFDWGQAARDFLACYRFSAGGPLSPEDREILTRVTARASADGLTERLHT